jgi:hypothetical protein
MCRSFVLLGMLGVTILTYKGIGLCINQPFNILFLAVYYTLF